MMTVESNTLQSEIKEADSKAINYSTQLESQPRGHLEGMLPLVQTRSAHPTGGLITLLWPGNAVPTALEIDEDEIFRRQFSKSWGFLDAQKKITAKQPRTGEPIEILHGRNRAYDCSLCRANGYLLRFLDQPSLARHCMVCT